MGSPDAIKYNIIWTENENLIDRFIPEIFRESKSDLKTLSSFEFFSHI